ncbi:MAG TPA: EF-Tu/IF-2/RF-3 family GTPase, partial [Candidatus Kapabacteria bacterium]|nr:EF-Tu/IF-2/RF-3 family GTPase [Candidatus Kapabacteria bacterium]
PKGKNPNTSAEVSIPGKTEGDPVLFIFKTVSEAHLGELSFFRVFNGTLTPGTDLTNFSNGKTERLNQLYVLNGKTRKEMPKLVMGDIGAVVKLKDTHTNNTLAAKVFPVVLTPVTFPVPVADAAIVSKGKGDEEKIAVGLHTLHEEDPTFQVRVDSESHQTIISGQGELHLDIIVKRLKEKFGVDVDMKPPRIPYREAIRGKAKTQYRHKKQSGGAGQFAEVHFYLEPYRPNIPPPSEYPVRSEEVIDLPWGGKLHFINSIVGGAIDAKFVPAVKKGIMEIMQRGVAAGYPVSDVRVVLYDGMMHPVDSNENAFRTAGRMCFRNAMLEAKPLLLEPIYEIEVSVPDENMGDVMGDLSGRRGKISGMDTNGHYQIIKAHVPLAELYQYSARLRSQTQGRGAFSRKFYRYEEMPKEIEAKILEHAKVEHVEEVE